MEKENGASARAQGGHPCVAHCQARPQKARILKHACTELNNMQVQVNPRAKGARAVLLRLVKMRGISNFWAQGHCASAFVR